MPTLARQYAITVFCGIALAGEDKTESAIALINKEFLKRLSFFIENYRYQNDNLELIYVRLSTDATPIL